MFSEVLEHTAKPRHVTEQFAFGSRCTIKLPFCAGSGAKEFFGVNNTDRFFYRRLPSSSLQPKNGCETMRRNDGELLLFWLVPAVGVIWLAAFVAFPGFLPPIGARQGSCRLSHAAI
jgi:hypothetical protein